MKKVMMLFTAMVFVVVAVGTMSFTTMTGNDAETGWYYVNPNNPDQALDPVTGFNECSGPSEEICAREFLTPGGGVPTDPTNETPIYGERPN